MRDRVVPGNGSPAGDVTTMFDRIAPIYDAMNTVMTLGLDRRWRRAAANATGLRPGARGLDIACGSGALTRELARLVGPAGTVDGIDLSRAMLRQANRRPVPRGAASPAYREGDALRLPFADESVDAATIAFGLRNVADHGAAIVEMRRVTRRGGRVVVLEIATPASRVGRLLAATWFERAVPILGRLVGAGPAYRYLPDSVRRYPAPDAIAALMVASGLTQVTWRALTPGLVTLHVGRRPGDA